jgi:ParB family chromosome partitioning protein
MASSVQKITLSRGYVRPEDEPPASAEVQSEPDRQGNAVTNGNSAASAVQRAVITIGNQAETEEDEDDTVKPLPDRLLSELTAYRTLALRDALANNPHVAMTALLHKLCLDAFQHAAPGSCLEASVRTVSFPIQPADLKDCPSAKAVTERHDAWKADLPNEEPALWDWLAVLDEASRAALLAHCVSLGVNALYEKGDRYGGASISPHGVQRRLAQADRVARAVGLDIVAAGWRPTVENYLGRVPKHRILAAVRETKGEQAAQLIDHLKKAEMAKEAERLLQGSGWVPEPLRTVDTVTADPTDRRAAQEAEALPAFLAEDQEESPEEEPDQPAVIAAE